MKRLGSAVCVKEDIKDKASVDSTSEAHQPLLQYKMKILTVVLCSLLAAVECSVFPSYGLPNILPPAPSPSFYGPPIHPDPPIQPNPYGSSCGAGQVLNSNGRCVTLITNSYIYHVPLVSGGSSSKVKVPAPQVVRNVIFVRLPEEQQDQQSIVVPPPEHKNIVYVLKKKGQEGQGHTIHVPTPQVTNPEIHFVNYGEGQNPTLPSGQNLLNALTNVIQVTGSTVDGGSGGFGGNGVVVNEGSNGYSYPAPPQPVYSAP